MVQKCLILFFAPSSEQETEFLAYCKPKKDIALKLKKDVVINKMLKRGQNQNSENSSENLINARALN